MTMLTCDMIRDRMPGLETGGLDAAEALQVERHLEACAACADERAVVELVRAAAPEPPPGLEARIRRAAGSGAAAAARPRSVPSFAVAAGVVFVLLTGSLLMRTGLVPGGDEASRIDEVTLGWPHVSDPILRTVPVLSELSVEELESLLAELES
jgi:Putative zinc-finger